MALIPPGDGCRPLGEVSLTLRSWCSYVRPHTFSSGPCCRWAGRVMPLFSGVVLACQQKQTKNSQSTATMLKMAAAPSRTQHIFFMEFPHFHEDLTCVSIFNKGIDRPALSRAPGYLIAAYSPLASPPPILLTVPPSIPADHPEHASSCVRQALASRSPVPPEPTTRRSQPRAGSP